MEFEIQWLKIEKLLGLDYVVLGNTLGNVLLAMLFFAVALFLLFKAKSLFIEKFRIYAARTSRHWDDEVLSVVGQTKGFFFVALAFFAATFSLSLSPKAQTVVKFLITTALFLQLLFWLDETVKILVRRSLKDEITSYGKLASPKAIIISFLARFVLYVLLVLMFLDNLGVNITALVTGLGVGGVAVALAVQNILGDLFASLSIALDKPFEVGDFIVVQDVSGTVEKVGLKTTRIRSITGEQVIFPNNSLLQSRVRNFRRMEERRVVFRFGLEYSTPPESIDTACESVKKLIQNDFRVRFDRTHCVNFGDSALEFEVVYWVLSADYQVYADFHHSLIRSMLKEFSQNELNFAFPTRTVHHVTTPGTPQTPSSAVRISPQTSP
jgi:small-conductance mechanosensitive channel